jgi:hypothetical protein
MKSIKQFFGIFAIIASFLLVVSCQKEDVLDNAAETQSAISQKDYSKDPLLQELITASSQLSNDAENYFNQKVGNNKEQLKKELKQTQNEAEKKAILAKYLPDNMPNSLVQNYKDALAKFKTANPEFYQLPIEKRKEIIGNALAQNGTNKSEEVQLYSTPSCIIIEIIAWGWGLEIGPDYWVYYEWFYHVVIFYGDCSFLFGLE